MMESLFQMQRFDPDADAEDATENVHEKENNKLKHLNNKLKRKHKVSVNENDVTAPEELILTVFNSTPRGGRKSRPDLMWNISRAARSSGKFVN